MAEDTRKVKLLFSYGGAIHRRPTDGFLRYAGGINRLVFLRRSSSLYDLCNKIFEFVPPPFLIKYQLPDEDLDALISISTHEDLENMMEEFDQIDEVSADGSAWIRLFVFLLSDSDEEVLVVDYLDAINGGVGALQRNGSPASVASNGGGMPPAALNYQDLPGLGFLGFRRENSAVVPSFGHQDIQLLNPDDNLDQIQGNVETSKTNREEIPHNRIGTPQEENSLAGANETLIPHEIDHAGVQILNPNGNADGSCPVHVMQTLVSSRIGHEGTQFLNPNVDAANGPPAHVSGGNLDRNQGNLESNQEEVSPRTDTPREENSLLEMNGTLIFPSVNHQGVPVSNPNDNVDGSQPVFARNVPTSVADINLNPNQVVVEPCLEENSGWGCHQCHCLRLSQFFPVHPSFNMPLPLLHPGSHCHSDMLINAQCDGNENWLGSTMIDAAAPGLLSHNSEDPMKLLAADWVACAMEPTTEIYPFENQKAACSNLEASGHAKFSDQPGSTGVLGDLVRVQASQKASTGGLVDSLTESNVEVTNASDQPAAHWFAPKPHDAKSLLQKHVEVLEDHSRVFTAPSTTVLSSENQLSCGALASHLIPSQSQQESLQQFPLTSSKQYGFDGSSVKNVNYLAAKAPSQVSAPEGANDYAKPLTGVMEGLRVSAYGHAGFYEQQPAVAVNVGTPRGVKSGNFLDTETLSRVSVPEDPYEYVRQNGMMEGLRVSTFEPTGFYEQQRQPVAVNVVIPGDIKSGNLPVVENNHAIRSQTGGNAVVIGNAFVNHVLVPEGNAVRPINQLPYSSMDMKPEQYPPPAIGTNGSTRPQAGGNAVSLVNRFVSSGFVSEGKPAGPINHMPPLLTDSTRLSYLQPSETFQMSTLMANCGPPLSCSQEMRVEPEVPIEHFLFSGVTNPAYNNNCSCNTINRIPAVDQKDEISHTCHMDVRKISGPPSGNIPDRNPPSSSPTEHSEHFRGSIPLNSVFNQDPQQILGDIQNVSSRSDKDSSKEFVFPLDLSSENCRVYSKVLPSVENGGLHHPQNSMSKGPYLEPVQFSQGEEHNKEELQAGTEHVITPVLQFSIPSVPGTFSHEESDAQSNKDSVLNESLQSAMALGEHKVEFYLKKKTIVIQDTKDKQSGKINLSVPIMDDITRLQIIKNSDLEELRELGSGTFGTVYHGKWKGSDVAIKRINNRCFAKKLSEEERMRADFWNEASNLADLHHPNVVAFYGVVLDGPGGSYATVTEFMVNGSLRQALQRNDRSLDRQKRLLIAMDVAFGMEYLHGKKIVHFDLKSDNLLVNLKDPQRPICKVADLGLSRVKRQTLISGGVRGTLPWMAPELLNGRSCLVSEKVDVFSFGIVMWELLTCQEPYADLHYGAIIGGIVNNTLRPPVPEYCDPDWRSLMEQCWSANPMERPSFAEIASRLRCMASSPQKR